MTDGGHGDGGGGAAAATKGAAAAPPPPPLPPPPPPPPPLPTAAPRRSLGARPSHAAAARTSLPKQLSLGVRASLASLGWHAAPAPGAQHAPPEARRSLPPPPAPPRGTTPLFNVMLWVSMAAIYVTGFTSALDRKWFLSLPGVSEALTHRVCARGVCPTPDDRGLQQAFFSAPPAGRLVGLVVGAWILRRHGRRAALAVANVWNIAAFATAAAAQSYYSLLLGSLMSEVSTGIFYTAVVVVDAELAPPNRRFAVMTAVVSVAMGLGVLNASCLALAQAALPQAETTWFWRVVTAFGAWPCMILLAIVPFVPESPLLQVQRGRTAEALQTLKDLRGPFADVKGEFSGIIHAVAAAEADDARLRRGLVDCTSALPRQLRQLLSRRHRPGFLVSILLGVLLGICSVGDDLADLMEVEVRPSFDQFRLWTLTRFIEYIATVSCALAAIAGNADRFSRRKLLAGATAALVLSLAGLAVIEAQPYGDTDEPPYPKALAAATFVLSTVVTASYYAGIKPACFLISAELSSAGVRGAAVAAAYGSACVARIFWGLVADSHALNTLIAYDSYYLPCTLTGALATALVVLVWLFVPDGTQCVPLEECRHAWQKHWFWGRHAERWSMDLQLPPRRAAARAGRASLRSSLSSAPTWGARHVSPVFN